MVIRDKLEPSLKVYPKHSPVGYRYLGAARPTAGGIRTSTTAGQLRADNNDDGEDNADYLEPIHGCLQHSAFLRPAFKALVADVATHLHAVKS